MAALVKSFIAFISQLFLLLFISFFIADFVVHPLIAAQKADPAIFGWALLVFVFISIAYKLAFETQAYREDVLASQSQHRPAVQWLLALAVGSLRLTVKGLIKFLWIILVMLVASLLFALCFLAFYANFWFLDNVIY